jgi:hypothetical protein
MEKRNPGPSGASQGARRATGEAPEGRAADRGRFSGNSGNSGDTREFGGNSGDTIRFFGIRGTQYGFFC